MESRGDVIRRGMFVDIDCLTRIPLSDKSGGTLHVVRIQVMRIGLSPDLPQYE